MKIISIFVYLSLLLYGLAGEKLSNGTQADPPELTDIEFKDTFEGEDDGESFEMKKIQMIEDDEDNRKIKVGRQKKEYPAAFNLKLDYFNSTMALKMKVNDLLMGIKPKLIYYENNTMIVDEDHDDDCSYYQGNDVNMPNSSATITVCDDGMDGVVRMEEKQLLLKPAKSGMRMQRLGDKFTLGPHVLTESKMRIDEKYKLDYIYIPEIANTSSGANRARRSWQRASTKYVEAYIVNDKSHYDWLGRNTQNNLKRMKKVLNIIDSLYQPHNIRVVFTALEVWNDYNKMTVDNSIDRTLDRFMRYRGDNIVNRNHHDVALMLSHIDFDGTTIGLAPMNGMCRRYWSANVNQDSSSDYSLIAGIMTHEMGHNLGMEHDTDSCRCHDRNGRCTMAPYAQNPIPLLFSECSASYLSQFLASENGYCMMNVPNIDDAFYDGENTCGNNKLDPGEECDCGMARFCVNQCCDANTCKLTVGSQCYTGDCCRDCQLVRKSEVCRDTNDPCDLQEECDGVNPQCPENLFRRNGDQCKMYNEDAYCYNGRCNTPASHCKYVFGGATRRGDHECYKLNTRGDKYGNCGISGRYYVKCSSSEIYCGKMFCEKGSYTLPIIGTHRGREDVSFTTWGRRVECVHGKANLGLGTENPAFAFTGMKCGDNYACRDRKCIHISQIQSPACPDDCNGRGVCTHKGTCVCNAGYAPPDCLNPPTTQAPLTTPTPFISSDGNSGIRTVAGVEALLFCLPFSVIQLYLSF